MQNTFFNILYSFSDDEDAIRFIIRRMGAIISSGNVGYLELLYSRFDPLRVTRPVLFSFFSTTNFVNFPSRTEALRRAVDAHGLDEEFFKGLE